jgi:adenylylsulfate kinase-like enzyme
MDGRPTASVPAILGTAAASLAAGALARQCCHGGVSSSQPASGAAASGSGRLVFVTGASGSGKTTVGEALRQVYGFVHIDGDRWTAGLNPVVDGPPSQEELQTEVRVIDARALL